MTGTQASGITTTAEPATPVSAAAALPSSGPASWLDVGVLSALALVLRLYHLNSQLWTDEVAALVNSFRRSAANIVTQHASFVSHPLYELMAHASIGLLGESAWSARLPAALLGTASVPVFYLVVRRVAGRPEALLAGGLTAVSYHHIYFSQDARGYTAMVLFALIATQLLLPLPAPLPLRSRRAYVLVACLGAYSVPFGACIAAGHFAVAIPAVWWHHRRDRSQALEALRPLLVMFVLAGVISAVLYLPLIGHTVGFATSASGGGTLAASARELWTGLRAGLGGNAGLVGGLAVALIGTVDYARRHPLALGLLAAPVVLTIVVLIALNVGVHPRYLMIALPLAFAVAARGLMVVARAAAQAMARAGWRAPATVGLALGLLVVAVSAKSLPLYYRVPKQDFLGALRYVDRVRAPGDQVVAAAIAGDIMRVYYRPSMPSIQTLPQLIQAETTTGHLYVITTLEGQQRPGDGPVFAQLHSRFRLVRDFPGTVEDGAMRVYESP